MSETLKPITCATSLYIPAAQDLDGITFVLFDYDVGKGKIIIECFGSAWAHYWGAMGSMRIDEFFLSASTGYIVGKMLDYNRISNKKFQAREEKYLERIVMSVKEAIREYVRRKNEG